MSSTLYVDKIVEKTSAAGVHIPGHVIQTVHANSSVTRVTTSSTTYINTGLTATITPTSTTSKILVVVQHTGLAASAGNCYLNLMLADGSGTELLSLETQAGYMPSHAAERSIGGTGSSYLHSPSTTSAITYKTMFKLSGTTSGNVFVEKQAGITLMEIAG